MGLENIYYDLRIKQMLCQLLKIALDINCNHLHLL